MKRDEVLNLYSAEYAKVYDDRFIHPDGYRHVSKYEEHVLDVLVRKDSKWLDVACGTGYFLSRHQDIQRAGIDISQDMLNVARRRNENALFIEQGDFTISNPGFNGKWDLVTCMWGAYCYVESLTEFNKLLENLVDWASKGGNLFLPLIDLEDVLYWRETPKYCNPDIQIFGGPCYVNGILWSYVDSHHEKRHDNLIAVHLEYIKERLERHFSEIVVVYYPPYLPPVPGQRKALIAFGKGGVNCEENLLAAKKLAEESKTNRKAVLNIRDLPNPSEKIACPNADHQNRIGWLRAVWRNSPHWLKTLVKFFIGENGR